MYILGMFTNFGGMDGIILLIIVLLLFGAKRLPELARGLGTAINEFNKAKDDVHRQITQAAEPAPMSPAVPASPVTPPVSAPPVSGEAVSQPHPVQEQPPKV